MRELNNKGFFLILYLTNRIYLNMLKIGLLSDTHGFWDQRYIKYFNDCDEIWHAGDIGSFDIVEKFETFKPFRAVYGNIDDIKIRDSFPEFLRMNIEDVDVLITHIGGYPGRYSPKVKQILEANPPKLLISGHSHILKVIYDNKFNCLTINPGAAGKYGFHKVRTLVKFVLDNQNIKDLEVIELAD